MAPKKLLRPLGPLAGVILMSLMAAIPLSSMRAADTVTLVWDPATDPTVGGYNVYYGTTSRTYTNMVDAGAATTLTISNLAVGATYYLAATTYSLTGLESDYSAEASYTNPGPVLNFPPTLDPLKDLAILENAGVQTVNLTGITSGISNATQTLAVMAFSSNPSLIPNPIVNYTGPNTTGTLTFAPATNSFGSVVMTVMVDNGGTVSNTVIRSFTVTVVPTGVAQNLVTNATIAPYSVFRYVVTPPSTNLATLSINLGPGAPYGARIVIRKGVIYFCWTPAYAQASTTNLITLQLTDSSQGLTTNQLLLVTVQDYAALGVGFTAVQAGQNATLPIALWSSDGVNDVTFSVAWPGTRFLNPSLSILAPAIASSSLQNQGTNLLIGLHASPGQSLQGSNLVAQLNFQTVSAQSSAFVSMPARLVSATKPTAAVYVNYVPQGGEVAMVSQNPLLRAVSASSSTMALNLFGKPGMSYQLEYSSNLPPQGAWLPLLTYTQTNLTQRLDVNASQTMNFYRLHQQ